MFSIPCQREQVYDNLAYVMVQSYPRFSRSPVQSPIVQKYVLEQPDEMIADGCAYSYLLDYYHNSTISTPEMVTTPASQRDSQLIVSQDLPPPYTDCVSSSKRDPLEKQMLELPPTPRTPAADDMLVEDAPSRHVEYLSHDWSEEDLRASRRYVRSHRDKYENNARLENAAWRAWTKLRDNLGTISPAALNW